MFMKRRISIFLVVCMLVTMFAACAKEEESVTGTETQTTVTAGPTQAASATATAVPEELKEINVIYWTLNTVPTEVAMVEEAINAITEPEIGVTVHLNVMDMGTYLTQASLMVSNGEKVDLMATFPALSAHYASMQSQGMLMPLNEYLNTDGQELMAALPEYFLDATTKDGNIYAIPCYKNIISDLYWVCRISALKDAGVDPSTIKNMTDIENALVAIHKTYPDKIALGGNAKTVNLTFPGYGPITGTYSDILGETTAVAAAVDYKDSSYQVISRYETEEWKQDITLLKKWYDMGLIDKDLANNEGQGEALQDSNVISAFGTFNASKIVRYGSIVNDKVTSVKLQDGTVQTASLTQMTWAVPTSATEPEAAVKFMNMMFTDERILNLLDYGVEGKHYVKNTDGTIGYPDGIDATNSGYSIGMQEVIGNAFLAYPWTGSNPDDAVTGQEIMKNATASPILGFSMDTSKVDDIYAQLTSICNDQYRPALVCGSAPEGYQEEFIKAMKDAGLDQYIAEAQAQLDAWLAAKK